MIIFFEKVRHFRKINIFRWDFLKVHLLIQENRFKTIPEHSSSLKVSSGKKFHRKTRISWGSGSPIDLTTIFWRHPGWITEYQILRLCWYKNNAVIHLSLVRSGKVFGASQKPDSTPRGGSWTLQTVWDCFWEENEKSWFLMFFPLFPHISLVLLHLLHLLDLWGIISKSGESICKICIGKWRNIEMYHLQQLETSLKYLHPKAYFCNLKNKISVVYASFHTDLVLRILEVGSLYQSTGSRPQRITTK